MVVDRKRLRELVIAETKLMLLEEHGVDNWDHYADALKGLKDVLECNLQGLNDE